MIEHAAVRETCGQPEWPPMSRVDRQERGECRGYGDGERDGEVRCHWRPRSLDFRRVFRLVGVPTAKTRRQGQAGTVLGGLDRDEDIK